MEITEVRIKLMDEDGERLKAFCSITFDNCFVVRDLKIIDGVTGLFVAMPSRKLTSHCYKCGMKNHLRAGYCNQCGNRLQEPRAIKDADGRAKLYADIAHPINAACREMIQNSVVAEYEQELERAKQPGYVSRYDDYDAGDYDAADHDPPKSHATSGNSERITRTDQSHSSAAASRPHHPPQGDPTRTGAKPRPTPGPGHASGPISDSMSKSERGNSSFGAGLF